MGRPSTQIAIFLVLLTAASNLILFSGVGAALGVAPSTGTPGQVEQVQEDADQLEPSQGQQDTLFGIFTSGTSALTDIYQVIFAAPLMFVNLGVPNWLTTFVFAPMAIVVLADVYHLLSGRDP